MCLTVNQWLVGWCIDWVPLLTTKIMSRQLRVSYTREQCYWLCSISFGILYFNKSNGTNHIPFHLVLKYYSIPSVSITYDMFCFIPLRLYFSFTHIWHIILCSDDITNAHFDFELKIWCEIILCDACLGI